MATTTARKSAASNTPTGSRVSDEDIEAARHNIEQAFQIVGLCSAQSFQCPDCGTTKKGKVTLKPAKGYWACYRCGAWGSTIKLLQERGGYGFADAVNVLLGRPLTTGAPTPPPPTRRPVLPVIDDFTAVVDVEVYNWILAQGDVSLAQWYYGRWHISADAVEGSGATVIRDIDAFHAKALAKWGGDRLVACGLVKPASATPNKKDFFLLNWDYCVIEPHRRPSGDVVGMQFRPNPKQERKIAAHKAYSKARDVAESVGEEFTGTKVDYVPKFLSLRGAGPNSLIGCNLPSVAVLPEGATVHIVEGFKDAIAAATMGAPAYAIPGVGVMPHVKVCEILARLDVVICMDGDAGGDTGRKNLEEHFSANGVSYRGKDMPAGMDVTDRLVQRNADAGHRCAVCDEWRTTHEAHGRVG